MRLFLIRHAHAGERLSENRDIYRPLSKRGHARAAELARLLRHEGIDCILSSPASRCVQTMRPLAAQLGLEIIEQPDLWERSPIPHVLALFDQHRNHRAVAVCSHGDVIPDTLDALGATGTAITGRGCEKGSVWVLHHDGDRWAAAEYLDDGLTTGD
ncbi:MAG: SixA phosphatase family protein [Acidimicrobiales bacterium]